MRDLLFAPLHVRVLAPGTIAILHDGISNPTQTIRALPQILTAAHRKGLRFVSIGTLRAAAV